ncbi:hypothetical protein CPB97_003946 [Podila verticillata]|nr:hypothetical protein CPB97_003946 [Podila verticillata]
MTHSDVNLSSNYYVHHDPTSQRFDHTEQAFGDQIPVSHDDSPTYAIAVLATMGAHHPHPHEYYHQPFSSSSSVAEQSNLDQSGLVILEHGGYMNPTHECSCNACISCHESQNLSSPMTVAMPFSTFRREQSAGSLSTDAASHPSGYTMDGLLFQSAYDMTEALSSLPNSPHVDALLSPPYDLQHDCHHYQHGHCQAVNPFNSDIYEQYETDTSYQGSSSPGPSESTTESIEEPNTAGGAKHPCPVPDCGKTFPRMSNLKTHLSTHKTHRPFVCTLCAQTFSRVHDRDRHMNSHLTLKPYACIVCQNRFARQDAVTRHLKMSSETNTCAWLLKAKGLAAKDVAAGKIPRSALGEEGEIRETLERMEDEARMMRANKTLEMIHTTHALYNSPSPSNN